MLWLLKFNFNLDNNELELASELQLIMKDKMELLQSKYIQYKKNIF